MKWAMIGGKKIENRSVVSNCNMNGGKEVVSNVTGKEMKARVSIGVLSKSP